MSCIEERVEVVLRTYLYTYLLRSIALHVFSI